MLCVLFRAKEYEQKTSSLLEHWKHCGVDSILFAMQRRIRFFCIYIFHAFFKHKHKHNRITCTVSVFGVLCINWVCLCMCVPVFDSLTFAFFFFSKCSCNNWCWFGFCCSYRLRTNQFFIIFAIILYSVSLANDIVHGMSNVYVWSIWFCR